MAKTNVTKVYRKGATASYDRWVDENTDCYISVDRKATVTIQTDISSKGGGTTCLWIEIGKDDLCSLLINIAEKHPEIAPVLIEALAKATEGITNIASKRKSTLENLFQLNDTIYQAAEYVDENYYDESGSERPREKSLSETLWATTKQISDAEYLTQNDF